MWSFYAKDQLSMYDLEFEPSAEVAKVTRMSLSSSSWLISDWLLQNGLGNWYYLIINICNPSTYSLIFPNQYPRKMDAFLTLKHLLLLQFSSKDFAQVILLQDPNIFHSSWLAYLISLFWCFKIIFNGPGHNMVDNPQLIHRWQHLKGTNLRKSHDLFFRAFQELSTPYYHKNFLFFLILLVY